MPDRGTAFPLLSAAIPPAALAYGGAPWWVLLATSLPGAAAAVLNALIPQNSHDRLELWRAWLRHRRRP
ncbi:hypothetical protein [Streptomyces sp. NRRL F-5123]|uniref:hypothetical protein n=1 Tax=Streptomyces sp. NRRL F-5123 TaxID=1463856 RepID=UPI00131DDDC4|nr:hypothetical protein [Streptomyces sp. NRRL F-5123]